MILRKMVKESSNFDITSIREAVGVDVEDAEGNPVEFTNDALVLSLILNQLLI